jgi:hypothetical protein
MARQSNQHVWYANGMTYIVVFTQKFAVKILLRLFNILGSATAYLIREDDLGFGVLGFNQLILG